MSQDTERDARRPFWELFTVHHTVRAHARKKGALDLAFYGAMLPIGERTPCLKGALDLHKTCS